MIKPLAIVCRALLCLFHSSQFDSLLFISCHVNVGYSSSIQASSLAIIPVSNPAQPSPAQFTACRVVESRSGFKTVPRNAVRPVSWHLMNAFAEDTSLSIALGTAPQCSDIPTHLQEISLK